MFFDVFTRFLNESNISTLLVCRFLRLQELKSQIGLESRKLENPDNSDAV